MKLIENGSFPIAEIELGERLRAVDPEWARGLAQVIKATGLQHPVEIVKAGNRHRLVAGAHRLAAFKLLGLSDIPARVMEPETQNPELEIRLDEIVENIGRRELSALDRAAHVAELKHIFQTLHGETRGGDRKSQKSKRQTLPFWSLSDDLSAKMKLSERTVRADAELFERLSPAIRQRIAGTWLAENRAQLVALSKAAAPDQKAVLDMLLAGEPKARNVNHALSLHLNQVDSRKPDEVTFARFVKLWGVASKSARKQIRAYLDSPAVMRDAAKANPAPKAAPVKKGER